MNIIAFGIFCFGDQKYFENTVTKLNEILNKGFKVYILTDNPNYFANRYWRTYVEIIEYKREIKSYHDKLNLLKYMTENHEISVIIDADLEISDWSFLSDFRNYKFKYGISYLETLERHPEKKKTIKDVVNEDMEWGPYRLFLEKNYPNYGNLETIWEYLLIFNRNGINLKQFFSYYEKLQLTKEFSDLYLNKNIVASGEGNSLYVSAKLSGSDINRDDVFYNIIKNKINPIK